MLLTSNINAAGNVENFLETLLKKSFLKNGEPSTVFMKFGTPAIQQGYKSVTWPRLNVMKTTLAQAALTEGTTPNGHDNTVSTITATPVQLGDYTTISDLMDVETLLPLIAAQGEELGNNAGRIIDNFIQNTLISDNSIGVIYAGTATSRAALAASDTISFDTVLKAITFLTSQGQTTEKFKIIMHPNNFRDFVNSSTTNTWLNKLIYEDYKGIKDGYVTSMENFDIYLSANVQPVVVGSGESAFNMYPVYAMRSGAYGVSTLQSLQTFYKPFGSAGTSDPLNQRATIGWKCDYGCAVLNPYFIVRIESRASTDYQRQASL